uniref:Uncharacterized protein n=1 Tax=Arundo donax TaxID=35708 RepID=A0A0A9CDI4_ARUDO
MPFSLKSNFHHRSLLDEHQTDKTPTCKSIMNLIRGRIYACKKSRHPLGQSSTSDMIGVLIDYQKEMSQ